MKATIHFYPVDSINLGDSLVNDLSSIIEFNGKEKKVYTLDMLDDFHIIKARSYIFKGNPSIAVEGTNVHRVEFYN